MSKGKQCKMFRMYSFVFLIFILILPETLSVEHAERPPGPIYKPDNQSETDFTHELLDTKYYDKHFRCPPDNNISSPTNVQVSMHVNTFGPIDVLRMDYHIEITLHLRWTDLRLRFINYNKTIILSAVMKDVWLPDIFFQNAKSIDRHSIPSSNFLLWLWPNGTLLFSQKLSLNLRCHMKLEDFPFDVQNCGVLISSFGMSDDHLMLSWFKDAGHLYQNPIFFSDEISLNEFYQPNITKTEGLYYSDSTRTNFSFLAVDFLLRRKQSYYLFNSYLPSVFIVLITWSSFAIDFKSAPARVSLSTLSLLALLTQTVSLERKLPPVSYITALGIWHIGCLLFIHVSLLEYMFVNLLTRKKVKKIVHHVGISAPDTCTNNTSGVNCQQTELGSLLTGLDKLPAKTRLGWKSYIRSLCSCFYKFSLTPQRLDNIFLAFYPLAFVIFNLFYWNCVVPKHAFYRPEE